MSEYACKAIMDQVTNRLLHQFPVHCIFRRRPLAQKELHKHQGFEFHFCLAGSGSLVTGQHIHPIAPGTLMIIRPNEVHRISHKNGMEFHRAVLAVDDSFLVKLTEGDEVLGRIMHQILPSPDSAAVRYHLSSPCMKKIQDQLMMIQSELDGARPYYDAIVKMAVVRVLVELARDESEQLAVQRMSCEWKDLVEGIKAYIISHHQEHIYVSELCKQFHVSRSHMFQIFKQATGCTIYQYLIAYRMNKAKELLLQTNLSVLEIAAASGYPDLSNFCSTFKKHTGVTPSQYRQLQIAEI